MSKYLALLLGLMLVLPAQAVVPIKGLASWYGPRHQGRKMANGKPFDKNKLTVASKVLPLGTRLRIKLISTGRSVDVTVTDRGPYVGPRILDLSEAAAREIGLIAAGVGQVEASILPDPEDTKLIFNVVPVVQPERTSAS